MNELNVNNDETVNDTITSTADNAVNQTTNEAIVALRAQLMNETEPIIDPAGISIAPPETDTPENSIPSNGFSPVPKSVVAENDVADVANTIEAMRVGLINNTETIVNPDSSTPVSNESADSSNSLSSGGFDKVIPKSIVAATDDIADAISALREQLANGEDLMVNRDGTFYNPADDTISENSLSSGGYTPVDKAVVAAAVQWYKKRPELLRRELLAMQNIKPEAKSGFMSDGKMCWTVRLRPIVCGKRKDWTVLMVYDDDHPQIRWGGSVKVYPVKPNISEMQTMVSNSSVTPKSIPHLLRDENQQLYMCTNHIDNIHDGREGDPLVTSAAACLRFAMRWITVFELGLIDQKTWTLFQDHGKI